MKNNCQTRLNEFSLQPEILLGAMLEIFVQHPNLQIASSPERNPVTRFDGFGWGCTERFNLYFKSQTSSVAAAGPVALERSPSTLEEFFTALLVWLQNLVFDSKSRFQPVLPQYLLRGRDRLCCVE